MKVLDIGETVSGPRAIAQGERGLKKEAVDIDCSRELGAVVRMGMDGDVGILLDLSREELRLRKTGQ